MAVFLSIFDLFLRERDVRRAVECLLIRTRRQPGCPGKGGDRVFFKECRYSKLVN